MSEERPIPRPRRAPRPAPDEDLDPVVPSSRVATAEKQDAYVLPVEVPRRRRGTPTVQVNVRLPPEVAELLDRVADATGALKSDVIESAIRHAYGKSGA